jgi:stage V sporulation protein B
LYRSPLTSLIGDEGNGYYSVAYNIYIIILMLSSYNIPAAVSKLIAEKLALGQYKNAHRVFICALWYVMILGTAAAAVLYFFADKLVGPNAAVVLRVFAPTILIFGPLGALRGYFQAHHTMTPTSVSQIFEQILNAGVSIGAAYFFTRTVPGMTEASREAAYAAGSVLQTGSAYMLGESAARGTDTQRAILGAAGSALGTGCGVLVAMLFMAWVYALNRRSIKKDMRRDKTGAALPYGQIFKLMLLMVTPILVSNLIYNFSTTLNQSIYFAVLRGMQGVSEAESSTMYGVYSGKATIIVNVPIAIAAAMSSVMIPAISSEYAKRNMKEIHRKLDLSIRVTMLVAIPSTVGLFVLARPITQLLFPQRASLAMASSLLRWLSITVVLFSVSTITNGVLQGIGKVVKPVVHASIALVIQGIVLALLLIGTNWNLYALVIASILYSGLIVFLNGKSLRKLLHYRQEIKHTFVMPSVAAAVMGAAAWGVYHGMYQLVKSNAVCLLSAICIAVCVYFIVLLKIGGVGERELRSIPKGTMLIRVAKKTGLL